MPLKLERLSALHLAEGLQLGHAAAALQDHGVFDAMKEPVTAEDLGRIYKLDLEMLTGVLDYLSLRTELVCKTHKGYATGNGYTQQARFLLSLYAGAYGTSASQLTRLLRRPSTAASVVNQTAFARAFSESAAESAGALPTVLRQLGFNHILDLGCGPASLLITLGATDAAFVGWGIELNPALCSVARGNIRRTGLARQLKVYEGDAKNPLTVLPLAVSERVRIITACNFCNDMFRGSTSRFEQWLRRIRRVWPGRTLVVADYYGKLGHSIEMAFRETYLHDYVQVISGQGVPPPDVTAWRAAYTSAACTLLHAMEDRRSTRFIHVVKL